MPRLPDALDSVRSWEEFTAAVAPLDTNGKGTAFEHLVRHYLRSDPAYRTKLADVWFHYEVPTDIRAQLNLPPRDQGVDLIARTHTGVT